MADSVRANELREKIRRQEASRDESLAVIARNCASEISRLNKAGAPPETIDAYNHEFDKQAKAVESNCREIVSEWEMQLAGDSAEVELVIEARPIGVTLAVPDRTSRRYTVWHERGERQGRYRHRH